MPRQIRGGGMSQIAMLRNDQRAAETSGSLHRDFFRWLGQMLTRVNSLETRISTTEVVVTEISDPDAPSTNGAVLYVRDNGAGKTQLCVRFPTGAVQTLATEI
jgi:hypothetical protein